MFTNLPKGPTYFHQATSLAQLACVCAALFKHTRYLHPRLFKFMPPLLRTPVVSTREFWISVFESKIEATIRNMADMIGWEDNEEVVGPLHLRPRTPFRVQFQIFCLQKMSSGHCVASFSKTVISASITCLLQRIERASPW